MTFSEKLKRLLDDRIQSKVAEKVSISPACISDYIHNGALPRIDTAFRLARVMGVSIDWLADDDQSWPPPGQLAS